MSIPSLNALHTSPGSGKVQVLFLLSSSHGLVWWSRVLQNDHQLFQKILRTIATLIWVWGPSSHSLLLCRINVNILNKLSWWFWHSSVKPCPTQHGQVFCVHQWTWVMFPDVSLEERWGVLHCKEGHYVMQKSIKKTIPMVHLWQQTFSSSLGKSSTWACLIQNISQSPSYFTSAEGCCWPG